MVRFSPVRVLCAATLGLSLLGLSLAGSALAQTPVQPQPSAPNMPAPGTTPPEKVEGGSGTNLSEKLNQSDGVIKPPGGVDPDIAVKPPVANPNSMPVITPPGTPGGNQNVQPK